MKNVAIILAGGSGHRLGGELPKQFLTIAGKTVMEHTIEAFHRSNDIDEIAIVSRQDFVPEVQALVARNHYNKVKHVLCGGKERYHSSLAALEAYPQDDCNLLFHDCVRPLVSQRIIHDCVEALRHYEAVDVAVPTTDTIIQLDEDGSIAAIPPRAMLRNVQTPQGFHRGTIRHAFDLALEDPFFLPTDDCSIIHRYLPQVRIRVVEGDADNFKITYKSDLERAEQLLKTRQEQDTSR